MYKKIYIIFLLKYNYFLFGIDQSSMEFFSDVFFISSFPQNTISLVDVKNTYSFNETTIENLNFTGNIFVIGNEEIQTNIYLNNIPTISTATDYLMINPNIMQVYMGNEDSPEPPTPDVVTIPNLTTDQIIAGNDGLYINHINSPTKLGNKSGVININANEIIFNGPLKSKSLFIDFNSPIVFKSNINKVENISATVLFCTSGIDKIYFNKLSITNPIATNKHSIYLGKSGINPGIVFNDTLIINQNLNTTFGSPNNNQVSILNIPIYLGNQKNINYLIVNDSNSVLKGNIVSENIRQSQLPIDDNFPISEINLDQNQSTHFPINVLISSSKISINKALCNNFHQSSLSPSEERVEIDKFNINNFLIMYDIAHTHNFSFISDDNYNGSFTINKIDDTNQNIIFNNTIFFKLSKTNQVYNKMGYDRVNNKLVKIAMQIDPTIKNNKTNVNNSKSQLSELDIKIKILELIYKKLLHIHNEMELS
jgi:hypothetical protein